MSDPLICQIYSASKKAECFIYVKKGDAPETLLPEAMRELLGEFKPVMALLLDESKKLANTEPKRVIESIDDCGYFVQMPPSEANNVESQLLKLVNELQQSQEVK